MIEGSIEDLHMPPRNPSLFSPQMLNQDLSPNVELAESSTTSQLGPLPKEIIESNI